MPNSKLIEKFQQQVAAHPHKVAVVNKSRYKTSTVTYTYIELNNRVNQLAHYLRRAYKKFFQSPGTVYIGVAGENKSG